MSPAYPFDDAATARAVIDESGTLLEWNTGAELLLGWPVLEVVGRPGRNLLVDSDVLAPAGPRWDGTVALRHRDGHEVSVWLLAHHRPPRDDAPGQWLLVTPLDGAGPQSPDDPLATAVLTQSPCAVAVYDERLRL
ncbi:MAG TPA: PAS domain-containing protein, partial [Actinomycetota bacterium]|nr:PAS domain-containing protein [Actinomycetota bacterium]